MRTAKSLIKLGGCPGCSETSLGAQVIVLVLSCCGTFLVSYDVVIAFLCYRSSQMQCTLDVFVISGRLEVHLEFLSGKKLFKNVILQILNVPHIV